MGVSLRRGKSNEGGGPRLVPGLAVRAGQSIAGKYRVEELVGRGPSGVVISARSIHLRDQVTLKILASYTDDQDELLKRRLKKARIASALKSEHVARIVDIGVTEEGMPYVATEAMEGNTLEAELAERGTLPVEEAVGWVLEACEGLAEAHAAGLVHGDLKPQNIFLAKPKASKRGTTHESDARVLKILDFGSTSPLEAIGDQSSSAFFGSPAFLAPEQIQSPDTVDARADIWGLGVLLYNLVSGNLPFEADTLSGVIVAVVYDAPSLLTEAPYELARLVHRCLDKDPAKRPHDVRELAAALAPFAGTRGARSSERVAAMLDASASGSIAPVSLSLDEADEERSADGRASAAPLPLVTTRASRDGASGDGDADATSTRLDQPTRPSQRVVARQRRTRSRLVAFAGIGGAAALALAAWAADRSASLPAFTTAAPAEVSITSAPLSSSLPATRAADLPDVPPPTKAGALPDAPIVAPPPGANASAATSEPTVSFAASSVDTVTPTPLAITPTPLATSGRTAPAVLPAPPPVVLPAPRVVTPSALPNAGVVSRPRRIESRGTTTSSRLPPGLPTTRDGSSSGGSGKLFSDRK